MIASSKDCPSSCSAQNAQKHVLFAAIKTMLTFYLLSIVVLIISFLAASRTIRLRESDLQPTPESVGLL
jgi:hypothetical protein